MEGELWKELYRVVMESGKGRRRAKQQFADRDIAMVYMWSVLCDRPVSWACCPENWQTKSAWRSLPSCSTMSRRLPTRGVQEVLDHLERLYRQRTGKSLFKCIDAMPMVIGNSSGDRQAGYGRSANGKSKGYKFYAILDSRGGVDSWRVGPMNASEKRIARRLVREASGPGYLIGDGEYDDTTLYALAARRQLQLVAPKKKGALGHRRQRQERLRGIELTQHAFGRRLLKDRAAIDRFFGSWNSWSAGIKHPPAWVRTHRRVRRWVQAKLIIRYAVTLRKQRLTA